ncbi:ATP-binding cassette domain-containing protein [Saccharothrix syringae]
MSGMDHPDAHGAIEVRGARHNNLRDVSLDIPKRRLTVFTGVSGSGKSSLVFGTIAAESRRLLNETYTAYVQGRLPRMSRPEVDALRNLSVAVVVDQERIGANARSTVGTVTDAQPALRVLFSRLGTPHAGPPGAFSPNTAEGACPACDGHGQVSDIDLDRVLDRDRSLNEGAINAPHSDVGSHYWQVTVASGYFDPDVKLRDFTPEQWHDLLERPATKFKKGASTFTYEGLLVKLRRIFFSRDRAAMRPDLAAYADSISTTAPCRTCGGTRLNPAALASKVAGRTIVECSAMQVDDLAAFVRDLDTSSVGPAAAALSGALASLAHVGLGYLSLDRDAASLSGGEAQRVKLVRYLGSALSDITYVFDEPTAGLHPHDVRRVNGLLLGVRDRGNTVLVVEHDPGTIAIADHVVDLGPGAGAAGGHVCYTGDVAGLRASGTATGRYLDHRVPLRDRPRAPRGKLEITGASLHNLRDVSVDIPVGVLTVVTGVSGAGKSSLVHGSLVGRDGVVLVDQAPIRGSRRGNPATYTGALDHVRAAFARANKVKAALFSANSEGACPTCKGLGVVYTDLAVMAGVSLECEACEGRRYTPEVLTYKLRGKDISEVLDMPVAQAREFFPTGGVRPVLDRLADAGLGYLRLGQPLTTLSGGERQRLKLAVHLAEEQRTYVLDEPTAGLHPADVEHLLGLLDRLVDAGSTVVVVEHHQAVLAHADWVVDVGPGAGHDGGRVVFTGTPAELAAADTTTAVHFREYLSAT